MNKPFHFVTVAVAMLLQMFVAELAEAAKGVKKVVPADAPHTITGEVLSVTPKNGGVNFQVRTATHHKKQGAAAIAAKPAAHIHDLTANATTRLVDYHGSPAFPAAVHHGVRVKVQTKGTQATNVQILTHNRVPTYFTRHRVHSYRPQMHYAHLHLHPSHHHYHAAHHRR
ncbi:MAG: hypothetical protein JWM11_7918 [Planctomycetaceae bacterium]|nr:hypothetical protein [Planctomycetaceae bacterium]